MSHHRKRPRRPRRRRLPRTTWEFEIALPERNDWRRGHILWAFRLGFGASRRDQQNPAISYRRIVTPVRLIRPKARPSSRIDKAVKRYDTETSRISYWPYQRYVMLGAFHEGLVAGTPKQRALGLPPGGTPARLGMFDAAPLDPAPIDARASDEKML